MSESDEIAANIAKCLEPCDWPATFTEAVATVRSFMPDETSQVIDNTAESLLDRVRK